MTIFIIADNQELTSFGLERLVDPSGEGHIFHAPDKTGQCGSGRLHFI